MASVGVGSRFFSAWTLAADLVLVNLAMVLVGLPVVTVGAGLVACFVVCLQLVSGAGAQPLRTFFRSFARGFLPATLAWLAFAVLGALLVWEWAVVGQLVSATATQVVRVLLLVMGLLAAMVGVWFWPLLARRLMDAESPVRLGELLPLARTALLASLKYLPRTLLALLIVAAPLVLAALSPALGARVIIWFVLIGLALACYLVVLVLRVPLGVQLDEDDE